MKNKIGKQLGYWSKTTRVMGRNWCFFSMQSLNTISKTKFQLNL